METLSSITPIEVLEPTLDYGGKLSALIGSAYSASYDLLIFVAAQQATDRLYQGGSWKLIVLSNGGFYMRWETGEKEVPLNNAANYAIGTATPDGMSIAVNLVVQNQLIWDAHSHNQHDLERQLVSQFYALREYAMEHPDNEAIFRFID